MDIITTRIITQSDTNNSNDKNTKHKPYKNLGECVTRMYNEEGLPVFFIGSVARVAWIAPFTAISLGLNERLKRHFLNSKTLKSTSIKLGMGGLFTNMIKKINPPRGKLS